MRAETKRLSGDERKRRILASSMRVFAEKGFDAATTKELAAAAGVSEALLYKHFPAKADIYAGLTELLGGNKDRLTELLTRGPADTAAFIDGFYFLGRLILLGRPEQPKDQTTDRLLGQSLLGDGRFAAAFLDALFMPFAGYFGDCLRVAARNGDLVAPVEEPEAVSTLFHHFIGAIALFSLPNRDLVPYQGERLLEECLRFAYRGVGLTSQAMARLVDFRRLDRAYREALGGNEQ